METTPLVQALADRDRVLGQCPSRSSRFGRSAKEMAYNYADLQQALTTWQLTDAQRAAGLAEHAAAASPTRRAPRAARPRC